jgi:uncharacterized damage-inducible protein DinB
MSNASLVILDSLHFLEQGALVLKKMDDAVYECLEPPFEQGGIGRHMRHVLDHFALFCDGVEEGVIDYDDRARDKGVEQSRLHALRLFDGLREKLDVWTGGSPNLEDGLRVRHNGTWCLSSVGRELQHLINHTVHHYAFVALILRLKGVDVEGDFGVAPSTLQAQMEK